MISVAYFQMNELSSRCIKTAIVYKLKPQLNLKPDNSASNHILWITNDFIYHDFQKKSGKKIRNWP